MLFGVVSFPGTNCESESVRALKKAGFDAKVILWNEPESSFLACDGLLVAGGFSYEDRGRSGVIAANDHALDAMKKMAREGKVIIGICNGAQILVESGLVTDSENPRIALTINKRVKNETVQGVGFYHDWCYLKNVAKVGRSPFNNFSSLIRMPLAHGEGRFAIPADVFKEMKADDQIVFVYTDESGKVDSEYPVNPNGSIENIAGVCNKAGNVLAMMPHPERGFEEAEVLFSGIAEWVKSPKSKVESPKSGKGGKVVVGQKSEYNLELFIEMIITDNSCETIRTALERKIGQNFSFKRLRFFGAQIEGNILAEAQKIVESEELVNVNKERVFAKINNEFFVYSKAKGFEKTDQSPLQIASQNTSALFAFENDDIHAQAKLPKLQHSKVSIKDLQSAICWVFPNALESQIVETGILANTASMSLKK